MKPRYCKLGITPPFVTILGQKYGVCALSSPCPDDIVCGYAITRNIIENQRPLGKEAQKVLMDNLSDLYIRDEVS